MPFGSRVYPGAPTFPPTLEEKRVSAHVAELVIVGACFVQRRVFPLARGLLNYYRAVILDKIDNRLG